MNVVLFQPQIPQNTGSIARTCAHAGANLYLVRPLGFHLTDRWLKRAGLDYWDKVHLKLIDDLSKFLETTSQQFYFYSAHAEEPYTEVEYQKGDFLIFGSETAGLPKELREQYCKLFRTIPKRKGVRCLNLANAVSIVLYEAWRQQGFAIT